MVNGERMKTYMTKRIRTAADADAFIRALHADGNLYHFDDNPDDIINLGTGEPVFDPDEVPALRGRVGEMFALDGYDPFELAVQLTQEDWKTS